jgi:hypothetical protein
VLIVKSSNPENQNDNQHPVHPQIGGYPDSDREIDGFKVSYVCLIKNE